MSISHLAQGFTIGNLHLKNRLVLAPLAGWSNLAYRTLCRRYGCALAFTEMIKAKALAQRHPKTWAMLTTNAEDSPLGVQIVGQDKDSMREAAVQLEAKGIAVVDINLGCPVPKVVNKGEGAALLQKPHKIAEILSAIRPHIKIPLTVKTRSGWDEEHINALEIAHIAEEEGVDAITVHGRTRIQYYSGRVDYNVIAAVKKHVSIPVIGNGDIYTPQDADAMLANTGCDAIMLARGTMGTPWIFAIIDRYLHGQTMQAPNFVEILEILKNHFQLLIEQFGDFKAVMEIRKVACRYIKGHAGSAQLRNKLSRVPSTAEFYQILDAAQLKLSLDKDTE